MCRAAAKAMKFARLEAVGAGKFEKIKDNLDLERWFRLPERHERRVHGRRHAGIRTVQDGPTLVLALDAHVAHPGPFTADDLLPYRTAREPPCQREALNRRKAMSKARSKKKRPILLAELERCYREAPNIQLSVESLFQEAFSGGRSGFVTPFGPFSASMTPQISVKPWMIPPIPCLT